MCDEEIASAGSLRIARQLCNYFGEKLYQTYFLTQVGDLAADSVTGIRFAVPDEFNSGQSLASGSDETDYLAHFQAAADPSFKDDIQAKLTEIGSTLTPDHIIKRALSQSCAGCHRLLNNTEEKPDLRTLGVGSSGQHRLVLPM